MNFLAYFVNIIVVLVVIIRSPLGVLWSDKK